MQIHFHEKDNQKIAEIISDSVVINTAQDALDLMANYTGAGMRKFILRKENLNPNFFDLSSGLAGEVLQKYVNYHVQLAIIGDFNSSSSENLKAFIAESNRGTDFFFLDNLEQALQKLFSC